MNKNKLLKNLAIGTGVAVVAAAALISYAWHQVTEGLSKVDWDNLNL